MKQRIGNQRTARGFTLLEVLVVLVITGLVSAMLIQGLGVMLTVRNSLAANILDLRSVILNRNIILQPLAGIIPDYVDKPHVFRGSRDTMQGLTIRSIDQQDGVPLPFRLFFQRDPRNGLSALIFQTEGLEAHVLGIWEGTSGSFAYRDVSGAWQENWPPPNDEVAPQTPWLIQVSTGIPGSEEVFAFVASPHERRYRIQDVMGGPMPDSLAPQ